MEDGKRKYYTVSWNKPYNAIVVYLVDLKGRQ